MISFLVQVSQYTPDTFPLDGNRRVVAPFWADVNTNNGGEVFYRETTDPNLLQQATDDVKSVYVSQRKFRATWLLVATWYKVAFFGASGNYTKKVKSVKTKKTNSHSLKSKCSRFRYLKKKNECSYST